MKVKWSGLLAVAIIALAITAYKVHTSHATVAGADGLPRIVLVADLSEADSADACAEIIHSVRELVTVDFKCRNSAQTANPRYYTVTESSRFLQF